MYSIYNKMSISYLRSSSYLDGVVKSLTITNNPKAQLTVDNSNLDNPILKFNNYAIQTGGTGVDTISAGAGIKVDVTNPQIPQVINNGVISLDAGDGILVDVTNPNQPKITNNGVLTITNGTGILIDNTLPENPKVINDGVLTITKGDGIKIDLTNPNAPQVVNTGIIGLKGDNITIDTTNPLETVLINDAVLSVASGNNINVDISDPKNPKVSTLSSLTVDSTIINENGFVEFVKPSNNNETQILKHLPSLLHPLTERLTVSSNNPNYPCDYLAMGDLLLYGEGGLPASQYPFIFNAGASGQTFNLISGSTNNNFIAITGGNSMNLSFVNNINNTPFVNGKKFSYFSNSNTISVASTISGTSAQVLATFRLTPTYSSTQNYIDFSFSGQYTMTTTPQVDNVIFTLQYSDNNSTWTSVGASVYQTVRTSNELTAFNVNTQGFTGAFTSGNIKYWRLLMDSVNNDAYTINSSATSKGMAQITEF